MAYLAMLVHLRVFDEIEVNFFSVGHTHSVRNASVYLPTHTCYNQNTRHLNALHTVSSHARTNVFVIVCVCFCITGL
jgi:hypothetical protein